MKKRLLLVLVVGLLMGGCGVDDITDQVANVTQVLDENVQGVKNGHPSGYPNITYGDAFEGFFSSPTWKYFVGVEEGPDEDGDGKPDYTIENQKVVEFTGYCKYMDVDVKALIQFVINDDDGTFQAKFLSFNDVPQNEFIKLSLLSKVFETYAEKNGMNTSGQTETSTTSAKESENTTTTTSTKEPEPVATNSETMVEDTVYQEESFPENDYSAADVYVDIYGIYEDDNSSYVLPESDTRFLDQKDLQGLSADECRIARNELYARYGRLFKDEELQKHFDACDWYHGTINPEDFDESILNEYEKANRDLIVQYEKDMGYR